MNPLVGLLALESRPIAYRGRPWQGEDVIPGRICSGRSSPKKTIVVSGFASKEFELCWDICSTLAKLLNMTWIWKHPNQYCLAHFVTQPQPKNNETDANNTDTLPEIRLGDEEEYEESEDRSWRR